MDYQNQARSEENGLAPIGSLLRMIEFMRSEKDSASEKLTISPKNLSITGRTEQTVGLVKSVGRGRGEITSSDKANQEKREVVIRSAIGINHLTVVSPGLSSAAVLVADQISPETREPTGWLPPAVVAPDELQDARRLMPKAAEALESRANAETICKWLITLGMLTKSAKASADSVEMMVSAYARQLRDFPAICFSEKTLDKATDRFSFFPSVAELKGFFGEEKYRLEKYCSRLAKIISIGGGA